MAGSEAAGSSPAKKFSLVRILVELLIVTLIAFGAGAAAAFLSPPQPATAPSGPAGGAKAASAAPQVCTPSTTNLIDLPPIVTNIGSPPDLWVRVEASIVFDARTTLHPDILAAEIATDELAYLRTLAVAQIEGPVGLENIRQDLADRAVVRSSGKVTEFILKTLVLQ